jgi:hypothetical protein
MRLLLKLLFCGGITVALPLVAYGGFWGLQTKFDGDSNASYEKIVQVLYNHVEKVSQTGSEVPTNFVQVLRAVFEPNAVKINFRNKLSRDGKDIITSSGTMYFSRGEFFLRYETIPPEKDGERPRNYATLNGKLYEWHPQEKKGRTLKRFSGDTVELIDYLIDPAMFMRYTLFEYHRKPENFILTTAATEKQLLRKKMESGFLGIRFVENPLWLTALVMRDPANPASGQIVFEVDPPKPIDRIPDDVKKLPENATFEDSKASVEWRLKYL